jgi:hypothetical protein
VAEPEIHPKPIAVFGVNPLISASINFVTNGPATFGVRPKTSQHRHKGNQTMNENNHDTENREENHINPYVLEVRRIREEIYREREEMRRKLGPCAFIDYLNKDAGTVTGNVRNTPPPPPPFPPSQEWLDFVAMLDRQEKEEQRRCAPAAAREAKSQKPKNSPMTFSAKDKDARSSLLKYKSKMKKTSRNTASPTSPAPSASNRRGRTVLQKI